MKTYSILYKKIGLFSIEEIQANSVLNAIAKFYLRKGFYNIVSIKEGKH